MVFSKFVVFLRTRSAQYRQRLTSLTRYVVYHSLIAFSEPLQAAWAEVKKEMTEEKGLDPAVADKIGEYVKHKGGPSLLEQLRADTALMANPSAKLGIEEMGLLFKYLEAYKIVDKVRAQLWSLVFKTSQ